VLADGGTAQEAPTLQDERFHARPAEVGGGRQAIVAAADEDRVVFSRHPAEYIDAAIGQPSLDNRLAQVQICGQGSAEGPNTLRRESIGCDCG
jgi:hypothetical protein